MWPIREDRSLACDVCLTTIFNFQTPSNKGTTRVKTLLITSYFTSQPVDILADASDNQNKTPCLLTNQHYSSFSF